MSDSQRKSSYGFQKCVTMEYGSIKVNNSEGLVVGDFQIFSGNIKSATTTTSAFISRSLRNDNKISRQ